MAEFAEDKFQVLNPVKSQALKVDVASSTVNSSCNSPSTNYSTACRSAPVTPSTRFALKKDDGSQLLELMDVQNAAPRPTTPVTPATGFIDSPSTPTAQGTTTAAVCLAAANELLHRANTPCSKAAITSVPGAVCTLVALLKDSATASTTQSRSCGPYTCKTIAALLWILSIDHQKNQENIGAELQAIPALIALLASPDPDTRMNAVGTLKNLCSTSCLNRARVGAVPGAVDALVNLLGDENAAVRKYSAQALGKLADVCTQVGTPVMENSVVAAAQAAAEPDRNTSSSPERSVDQAAAVAAPTEAEAAEELAGEISSVGSIPCCRSSTRRPATERATITLHDWGCSSIQPVAEASAALAKVEQIPVCSSSSIQGTAMISKLVGLLRDEDAGVRAQATTALRTLGRSISSKARISAEIAFSPTAIISSEMFLVGSMSLKELMQLYLTADPSGTVKLSAAAELSRRAGTAEGRTAVAADAVLQAAVIQSTVAMLADPVAALRKHAAGILCCLCTGHAEHQQLVGCEPGAVPALVSLLNDEVTGVARQALGALAALAKDNAPNQIQIAGEAGAVKALCGILADDTVAEATRRLAASALLELNSNAGSRNKAASWNCNADVAACSCERGWRCAS